MKAILLIVTFTLVVVTTPSSAVVFGGSNLGMSGYPEHSCYKPDKPHKPYSFDSEWEVDLYNRDIDRYDNDLEMYIDCIREYVENAENDIKRITEKASEAIDEANG